MPNIIRRKPTRLMNEQEVLKHLGITDFRHLSKDTAIEFISSIPQMDKDVVLKALDQFPELANTALGLAKETKESLLAAFEANDKSSQAALTCNNTVIDILTRELDKEELTPEEKLHIIDSLRGLAEESRKIHKDDQNFIINGFAILAATVTVLILGTVAVLGVNGKVGLPDLNDSSDGEGVEEI